MRCREEVAVCTERRRAGMRARLTQAHTCLQMLWF